MRGTRTDRRSTDSTPGDRRPELESGPDDPGDPQAVARIICLRMLDSRARTRAELARALEDRGVPGDAATPVLDRFAELGLIDDAALAQSFAVARHAERGLARRAIAVQLKRRGVDDETIDEATRQIGVAEEQRAAYALAASRLARMAQLDPATQQRRLASLLARRGYSAAVTYDAVRAALANTPNPHRRTTISADLTISAEVDNQDITDLSDIYD